MNFYYFNLQLQKILESFIVGAQNFALNNIVIIPKTLKGQFLMTSLILEAVVFFNIAIECILYILKRVPLPLLLRNHEK